MPKENLELPPVCLLSLGDKDAVVSALQSAWDAWWGWVERVIRETKVQLMQMVGRLEPWEGFDPAEVKLDDLLVAAVADRREEYGCRVGRILVGRHAIVWKPDAPYAPWHALPAYSGQPEIRDETVVRFYHLGCRVRVEVLHPGVPSVVMTMGRPMHWFFKVVEERLVEI
jgi:hypothetical protein